MAPAPTRPRVFLDLALNGAPAGRLVIELAVEAAPRTAENFRALCTGEAGTSASGARLWYKGCAFHRCVSDFMLQGGDFTRGDGTGGESIYGPTFPDEAFTLKHAGPGILSMANAGPDTNGSQFFLTTTAAPWLDGKHVVFGRVVSGLGVLRKVDTASSSSSGAPRAKVVIADCGELASPAAAARAGAAAAEEVDADAASRARLARLQGGGGPGPPAPRPKLPVRTAQDDLADAEAAEAAAEAEAAAAAAAAEPGAPGADEDGGPAEALPPAPDQPASAREAKLAGLRARLAAARKANAGAAIAEKRREAAARGGGGGGGGGGGEGGTAAAGPRPAGGGSWKAWEEAQAAERAAALAKAGLGPDKAYLLARPDAHGRDEDGAGGGPPRKKKAGGGGGGGGGGSGRGGERRGWGGEALAAAYERRVALTVDPSAVITAAGPSTSGGPPSEAAMDRLVAGLNAAAAGRAETSRRRAGPTGAAGGISAPNAAFNDKLQKAYGRVAAEIRANLERGTALPD